MFKVNNKEARMTSTVFIFNFIVNFTYSGVFIVNFEHISHLARREKCRNTCFVMEKRKKSEFNRFQMEVFFPPKCKPTRI